MSNYRMQMPARYTSIGDDEMVLLCGGETTAWQTFQDIGRVLNYVARIFSAGSSMSTMWSPSSIISISSKTCSRSSGKCEARTR